MFKSQLVKEYLSFTYDFKSLEDWLLWPPNTFLVTSNILQKTGAYKIVLSDDWDGPENEDTVNWQGQIEHNSQVWKEKISQRFHKTLCLKPQKKTNFCYPRLRTVIQAPQKGNIYFKRQRAYF